MESESSELHDFKLVANDIAATVRMVLRRSLQHTLPLSGWNACVHLSHRNQIYIANICS